MDATPATNKAALIARWRDKALEVRVLAVTEAPGVEEAQLLADTAAKIYEQCAAQLESLSPA